LESTAWQMKYPMNCSFEIRRRTVKHDRGMGGRMFNSAGQQGQKSLPCQDTKDSSVCRRQIDGEQEIADVRPLDNQCHKKITLRQEIGIKA